MEPAHRSSNSDHSRQMACLRKWAAGALASFISLALVVPSPTLADAVVVSSSGPSADRFPPGTILPDGAEIRLQRRDQITVINAGRTTVETGPGDIVIGGPSDAVAQARLTNIFSTAREGQDRVAATRNYRDDVLGAAWQPGTDGTPSTPAPNPPTLWHINPAYGGDWCYWDAESLELWRSDDAASTEITFQDSAGTSTRVRWSQGEGFMFWPYTLYPEDEGRYFVQTRDYSNYLTLHQISIGEDLVSLADALLEKSCYHQLSLLDGDSSDDSASN